MMSPGLVRKLVLFGIPFVLMFGSGVVVAYHDGVTASNVHDMSSSNDGQQVTVKGRVFFVIPDCGQGWAEMSGNGSAPASCFVMSDISQDNSYIFVTSNAAAPANGTTVVAHGVLRFFASMNNAGSGSYGNYGSYNGMGSTGSASGCTEQSSYGTTCASSSHSSPWGGSVGWIDASDLTVPWFFR
ncbi:MAG: hypothetical protein ACYDDF_00270 [Thermoplasmatota archaeon]